jgi:hypothetical protein
MVHATERNESRKEKPVPHPDPLLKVVKTKDAEALLGVSMSSAMQIAMVARIFIGANQRTMWCKVSVAREEIMPATVRMRIERRTTCKEVLRGEVSYPKH